MNRMNWKLEILKRVIYQSKKDRMIIIPFVNYTNIFLFLIIRLKEKLIRLKINDKCWKDNKNSWTALRLY